MRRSVRLFLPGGIAVPAVALTTAAVPDSAIEGYTRQRVTTSDTTVTALEEVRRKGLYSQ